MNIAIMLMLVLAVLITAVGVLYWFFQRLKQIEEKLWGTKRQEASDAAQQADENTETESL